MSEIALAKKAMTIYKIIEKRENDYNLIITTAAKTARKTARKTATKTARILKPVASKKVRNS